MAGQPQVNYDDWDADYEDNGDHWAQGVSDSVHSGLLSEILEHCYGEIQRFYWVL